MAEYDVGKRDIIAQDIAGEHYNRHIHAMTVEGLHSKSDIAAELAHRDILIEKLQAELERAFQILECNGVPRQRAKTVAGGIDVLAQRWNKEGRFSRAENEKYRKALEWVRDFDDEQECLPGCDSIAHEEFCPWVNDADCLKKIAREALSDENPMSESIAAMIEDGGHGRND